MPKKKIENLITHLHEDFGDIEPSAQQQQLLNELQQHMHNWSEPEQPVPVMRETVELLVESFEASHPDATATIREILKTLGNLGI